jgi:D-3-phosphoglycerate dehydrogenase / 2-oxoglutarate reductase
MKIIIPDKVSKTSKKIFEEKGYIVEQKPDIDIDECSNISKDADAIIVRSYKLHELKLADSLFAIGRAGAGVNNIPIDKCTESGVVVFNTPGANANAVKELVLCGLLLSSRRIITGVNWTANQKEHGEEVPKLVEKNKKQFKGIEVKGKKLGVIGLGAIGMLVANDALALGMDVDGYDPYLSVENAWKLSKDVKKAVNIDSLISDSDYITIHVPLTDITKGMLNKEMFNKMKDRVRIMNFSRDGLVNTADLIEALGNGKVSSYVTDFPNSELIGVENVVTIPHLGASTAEAEENCAVMITSQINDFLKNGNIINSVNFPICKLERNGSMRITIVNKNIPGMIERITDVFAGVGLNIEEMLNKSREDVAYNIFDVKGDVDDAVLQKLSGIEGVLKVRKL